MPTGSMPPENSFQGSAAPDPALAESLEAVRGLGAGRFDVLGPLGKDREGEYAFLGRELGSGRLAVLKRRVVGSASGFNSAVLQVIDRLDSSVPPPAGSCAFCHTPFGDWEPSCPDCGADLAGSAMPAGSEEERAVVLQAVRKAAPGYEVLGQMVRSSGGGVVFFARESVSGQLVALRLDEGAASDQQKGLTVAATRMMRPHISYGAVAGESAQSAASAGSSRPWSAIKSPSIPLRSGAVGRSDFGTGAGGQDTGGSRKICPQCGEAFEPELRFCPKDGAALRARDRTEDLVGQVIAERYHITRMLGEGGMGRVYLAEHVRMGRTCAVKVMNPRLLYDPDSVSRFSREAANASRITHPNVAAIYDFGETDDIVYIAMEYVDGPSLAAVLAKETRLSEQRVVSIGLQVADALTAAHDFGIVHRDLKPDNIMLTRSRTGEDTVKVVDFGIAKATQGDRQTVTRTGFVIGTPAYMSPEQILGDTLDGRSDIYSLGCILYEMVTGTRAFAGPSGEVSIHQRLTEPPPQPRLVQRDLSRKLDNVVTTALARSPDQRFQSAASLRAALVEALSESGGQATSTVLRHRSSRTEGPRIAWVVAIGAGVIGLGIAAWLGLRPGGGVNAPLPKISSTPTAPPSSSPVTPAPAPTPNSPISAPPIISEDSAGGAPPSAPPIGSRGAVRFEDELPSGARVAVDGKDVRLSADGSIPLSPGRHGITVRVSGFRSFSQTVRIVAGQTENIAVELVATSPTTPTPPPQESPPRAPTASPGTIAIRGNLPEGAAIDVDGRPLAIGVRSVIVMPGLHWVRLSVPGYRSDSGQVEVTTGQEAGWTAPALVAIVKSAPAPSPGEVPSPKPTGPPPPALDETASEEGVRAEIVTLLSEYEKAINARDLNRLKTLYPAMRADMEGRWRDLFGKDVNDLKATVTLTNIVPASAAQLTTFKLVLSFKPTGGKVQKYQLTNVGTVRHEPSGWRFLDILESGN